MRRTLLIAAVALTCLGMGRKPPSKGGKMNLESGKLTWSGGQCAVKKPAVVTIRSSREWDELWSTRLSSEAPKLDFKTHFAVAVFLGARPTGGFAVKFPTPVAEDGKFVVLWREHKPSKSGFVTMAFTTPYGIRAYARTDAPILVRELH